MHAEDEMKAMKMKMDRQDLGESSETESSKCPSKVKELLGDVQKLQTTVRQLASKLNLTGEQQRLLTDLMRTVVIPAPVNPAAKPPAKPAAKPPAKPPAKSTAKSAKPPAKAGAKAAA